MSSYQDRSYFAERERECRKLADEATDPSARAVHLQLARYYARRARPDETETIPYTPSPVERPRPRA